MQVKFKHWTPLHIVSEAIRECYDSHKFSDSIEASHEGPFIMGEKDKALIHKVGNLNKHASTLEHLVFSIQIKGVSRLLLQEFARHRIASLSVKSTRFTLQELEKELSFLTGDNFLERAEKYIVFAPREKFEDEVDYDIFLSTQVGQLEDLRMAIQSGISRDVAKYLVPDCYKTNIAWTINARSMQNFLYLRTASGAHFEIRELANLCYTNMPDELKYLFTEYVHV